jgi:hypothetical protein
MMIAIFGHEGHEEHEGRKTNAFVGLRVLRDLRGAKITTFG